MHEDQWAWRDLSPTFYRLSPHSTLSPVKIEKIENRERAQLLALFEDIAKYEQHIYNANVVYRNLHLYLMLTSEDVDILDEEIEDKIEELFDFISKHESNNLVTLQLRIEYHRQLDQPNEKNEIITLITKVKKNKSDFLKLEASAKHQIAFYFARLDARLYKDAYHIYCKNAPIEELFWKYQVAHLLNQTLNKDFLYNINGLNARGAYEVLRSHLEDVIKSNETNFKYRAFVDLADAHKKLFSSDINGPQLPNNWSRDKIYEYAYAMCKSDGHVLERCGRHMRHLSSDRTRPPKVREDDLMKAISILGEAVQICPKRHVAWHHRGLCYRNLWLNKNSLHTQWKKKKSQNGMSIDNIQEVDNVLKCMPGYNHSYVDKKHNEHLEEAKRCLQEACNMSHQSKTCISSVYLIDLARICASLGKDREARKHFRSACNSDKTRTCACDESKKYEHFAVFRFQFLLRLDHGSEEYMRERKDVKEHLQKSVEKAVYAQTKPHLAFMMISWLIRDEMRSGHLSVEEGEKELTLVNGYMEYKEAKAEHNQTAMIGIGAKLVNSIDLYVKEKEILRAYHHLYISLQEGILTIDQSNVRDYLAIAYEAAKLKEKSSHDSGVGEEMDQDSSKRKEAFLIYSFMYEILCKHLKIPSAPQVHCSPHPMLDCETCDMDGGQQEVHITLMAHDADSPTLTSLREGLNTCGFHVHVFSDEGDNSLSFGGNCFSFAEDNLSRTATVLYHVPREEGWVSRLFEGWLVKYDKRPVCLLKDKESAISKWDHLPSIEISESEINIHDVMKEIITKMFSPMLNG